MFTIEEDILEKARERYDYYKLMSKYANEFGFELKGTFDDIYKELCDVVDWCYDFDVDENGEYTNIDFSDEDNLIDLCDLTFEKLYSFKSRCIVTTILHDCGYHFPIKKFDILMSIPQYMLSTLYVFDIDCSDHSHDNIENDEDRIFEIIFDNTEDVSIHTLFRLTHFSFNELKKLKPYIKNYGIIPGDFIKHIDDLSDHNIKFVFDCFKAGICILYTESIEEMLDAPKPIQRKFIRECQKKEPLEYDDVAQEIICDLENIPFDYLEKVIKETLTNDEFANLIANLIVEKMRKK